VLADNVSQRQIFHHICQVDIRLGSTAMKSVRLSLNEETD